MDGWQQFRCPCCGEWLACPRQVWLGRGSVIFYCEACSAESDPGYRTGPGRNQCQFYRDYPASHDHWSDPKPALPAIGFAICYR